MIDVINPELFLLQVMTDIVSCIFFVSCDLCVMSHDSWFTMRAHFCSCRYCNDVFDVEMGQFFLYCHTPDSWLQFLVFVCFLKFSWHWSWWVCLTCLFVPPLALHLLVMPSSSSPSPSSSSWLLLLLLLFFFFAFLFLFSLLRSWWLPCLWVTVTHWYMVALSHRHFLLVSVA